MITYKESGGYVDVFHDDVFVVKLMVSILSYDVDLLKKSRAILLQTNVGILKLGNFEVASNKYGVAEFNEVEFIKQHIMNIENPAFDSYKKIIGRDSKIDNILNE